MCIFGFFAILHTSFSLSIQCLRAMGAFAWENKYKANVHCTKFHVHSAQHTFAFTNSMIHVSCNSIRKKTTKQACGSCKYLLWIQSTVKIIIVSQSSMKEWLIRCIKSMTHIITIGSLCVHDQQILHHYTVNQNFVH